MAGILVLVEHRQRDREASVNVVYHKASPSIILFFNKIYSGIYRLGIGTAKIQHLPPKLADHGSRTTSTQLTYIPASKTQKINPLIRTVTSSNGTSYSRSVNVNKHLHQNALSYHRYLRLIIPWPARYTYICVVDREPIRYRVNWSPHRCTVYPHGFSNINAVGNILYTYIRVSMRGIARPSSLTYHALWSIDIRFQPGFCSLVNQVEDGHFHYSK